MIEWLAQTSNLPGVIFATLAALAFPVILVIASYLDERGQK